MKPTLTLMIVCAASLTLATALPVFYDDFADNNVDVDYPYGQHKSPNEHAVAPHSPCNYGHARNTLAGYDQHGTKVYRRRQDGQQPRQEKPYHDTFTHFHKHGIEHFYPPIAVLG